MYKRDLRRHIARSRPRRFLPCRLPRGLRPTLGSPAARCFSRREPTPDATKKADGATTAGKYWKMFEDNGTMLDN